MPGIFGKSKDEAAKGPAASSSYRPQQERRHSDHVKSGSSLRPGIFASKTWHTPTTGEPSPNLSKSKKHHGRVRSFFSNSDSSDDEDDDGYEFKCRGVDAEILVTDKGSSSRENASLQPAQHRVSSRSRSMAKSKMPSSRSSSQDSPTPRKTFAPPTIPKSPYPKLSATSHTNPRSIEEVHRPRDRNEDSGAASNQGKSRGGRDGRNSSRNRERDAKVQSPDDDIISSSRDHNDEKRKHSRPKNDYNNGSDYKSSSNEHKLPSGRRENPRYPASKAVGNGDKNRHVRKPHFYQVHDYSKDDHSSLNRQHRGNERGNLVSRLKV
ncbi:uncharacterized protein Bfra_011095 [Botrytis fragariae]|uniref:Uncharacterized protein n=1 Tax=Botrytis fragariae TaxID=1964551 RepID=A0A8H6AKH8_9HELO|nr:uncharacterized protein Bfra_011095 [Botrytis fragariae]KAF5869287.1 hypothetical protein Bfra_011095 [Botrytis fragariae]